MHGYSVPRVSITKMPFPPPLPRIYPDPFGEAVANPIDDLKLHKFGIPNLPNPLPDPVESFKNTESMKGSGLFDYAGLESVYKYLRKGTNLHIPKEWEGLVPNSI